MARCSTCLNFLAPCQFRVAGQHACHIWKEMHTLLCLMHIFLCLCCSGDLRSEALVWRADRDEWLGGMRAMRQEVNDKLLQMEQGQARAQVELQGAKSDMQVGRGGGWVAEGG